MNDIYLREYENKSDFFRKNFDVFGKEKIYYFYFFVLFYFCDLFPSIIWPVFCNITSNNDYDFLQFIL